MAVDRGGLDYKLNIQDGGLKRIDQFNASISKARENLAGFRQEQSAKRSDDAVARALREEAVATRALNREKAELARNEAKIARARNSANTASEVSRLREESRTSAQVARSAAAQAAAEERLQRVRLRGENQLAIIRARSSQRDDLSREKATLDAQNRTTAQLTRAEARLAAARDEHSNRRITQMNAEARVAERLRRIQEKELTTQLLAAKGIGTKGAGAGSGGIGGGGGGGGTGGGAGGAIPPLGPFGRAVALAQKFNAALGASNLNANRLSFTFRRLFGILAAFTAVRLIARGFADLVKQAIEFNAKLEQAQLGIASILTAVADVRDATGSAVDASTALGIAQQEAAKQTQLLRKDALETTATLEDLVQTFQTALAPGFQAGLNLDQIRQFSVQISQAASAIGLAQDQLSEEIRSILQGTISQRTTRIATALGITNDDIKRAKELGTLFDLLQSRFAAFSTAGEKARDTFEGIRTNLQDAISLLVGTGSLKFFENLKSLLKDIFNVLVNADPITGLLTPDPQAVKAVEAIADGLSRAVDEARALGKDLNLGDVTKAGAFIGDAIATTAQVIRGLITGIVQAFGDLKQIIQAITGTGLFDGLQLSETIAAVTRIIVLVTVFQTLLGPIFGTLTKIFSLVTSSLAILGGPLTLALAAALAITIGLAEAARRFYSYIFGVDLKFATIIKLARLLWTNVLVGMVDFIQTSIKEIIPNALGLITTIATKAISVTKRTIGQILQLSSATKSLGDTLVAEADVNQATGEKIANQLFGKAFAEEAAFKVREALRSLNFVSGVGQAIANNDQASIIDEIRNAFTDLLGIFKKTNAEQEKFNQGAEVTVNDAFRLSSQFKELPGIIGDSNKELSTTSETLEKLKDDLRDAVSNLAETQASLGLSNSALSVRKELFKSELDTKKEVEQIDHKLLDAEKKHQAILEQSDALNARRATLTEDQQKAVEGSVPLVEKLVQTQTELGKQQTAVNLATIRAREAQQQGLTDEAAKLKEVLTSEKSRLQVLLDQKDQIQSQIDNLGFGLDPEQGRQVAGIVTDIVRQKGSEVAIDERITALLKERRGIESAINAIRDARIKADALSATFEIQRQNRLALVELDNLRREAASATSSDQERSLVSAQNEVSILNEQILLTRELRKLEIESLTADAAKLTDLGAIEAVQQNILALKEQDRILSQQENAELEKRLKLLEVERIQTTGNVEEQVQLAAKTLNDALPTRFEIILDTLRSAISGFSEFVSQSIVDAFDPTKKGDIRQRFGQFLQALAQQIINTLITIAVTRAVLGLTGVPVGLAGGGQVPHFKRGGPVIHERHRRRRGYASGGEVDGPRRPALRPAGVPASDTVNAWLTPGEFVQQVAAVRMYGTEVMEKINKGLVDPLGLRALAGVRSSSKTRAKTARGPGFATGGEVPRSSISSSPQPTSSSSPSGFNGPIPAYIAANDQSVERLLSGGKAAALRFMDENGFVRR